MTGSENKTNKCFFIQEGSPTTKVLHISDVHLDLSYKVGTNTDCGLPMCCMNFTEMADDPKKAAGYWGAYYCDLPVWTFEDMLSQIRDKFSNVRFTIGEITNHNLNTFSDIKHLAFLTMFPGNRIHYAYWGLSGSRRMASVKGQ